MGRRARPSTPTLPMEYPVTHMCNHLVVGASLMLSMASGPVSAQAVISLEPDARQTQTAVTAPPSVGNGIANGVAKPAGAPSVGDGRANGVVKQGGAPSVGAGVANGVVKSTTVNQ